MTDQDRRPPVDTELESPDEEMARLEASHGGATAPGAETVGAAETAGGASIRHGSLWSDAWIELRHNPLFVISALLIILFMVMAIAPQLFTNTNPRDCSLSNSLVRPSREHWFGFDLQGCDYYTQVLYGARASISIGLLATAAATAIAIILGALAGYYSGLTDALLARVTDVWFAIPTILGGIVLLSVVEDRGITQVAAVLIVLGWPTMMRLMRSSVLSTKEGDYVMAARALGAGDLRIMRRHILPNAIAPVIVYATIYVGIIISAEAALTFLGVGLELPAISWGLMLGEAQSRLLTAPHLLLFPGVFLSMTIFAFILMGDALRDALDPKLR
jgi:oligopeptide transport system permease protein